MALQQILDFFINLA